MFVSTLRLSANRSVSRRACGSHHSAPFTHPDLDNSCEKGAVARSPFDIQFISASTTDPVRRSSVGLRGASVSRALIVLRAFGKLSAFIECGNSGSSFQPILILVHTLVSVRGCFFVAKSLAI